MKEVILSIKLGKKRIKILEKGKAHHFIWGIVCAVFGIMIADVIVSVSHFYKEWFFILCYFVFSLVIMSKYQKNWDKFWNKRKKKKKYIKVNSLENPYN